MLAHLAYVEAAEGCTPKCDDASRRVQVERENSEQGGLAATIRSEHDPALTVVEVKAQVIDDAAPIMNDGRMSQAKHRVGGGVRRHWVDGSRSGRRSWQSVSMSNARDDLENGLARVLGVNAVVDLTRLTSGASRETWSFVADGEKYILQRERSGGVGRLRHEPALLRAAASAGVPVPEVVVDGSESDALERPFMIVRFIEGETIARRILRDDSFSNTRSAFVREVAMAMARLHSLPVDVVPGLDASDQLRMYDKLLCDLGQPHPAFELVLRWLNDNKPLTSRRTIVHGDLRLETCWWTAREYGQFWTGSLPMSEIRWRISAGCVYEPGDSGRRSLSLAWASTKSCSTHMNRHPVYALIRKWCAGGKSSARFGGVSYASCR